MYTYPRRRSAISPLFVVGPAVLFLALAAVQILRGLPALQATTTLPERTVIGEARQLPLPAAGASSVAVAGLGTLASAGTAGPRPLASLTKMMTARVILKDHPLKPGEQGPSVTTTATDASRYVQMVAEDQSVLPVTAGMVFSEYELLQGLLIPSANNFAEILAVWDAGSLGAFVQKMNAEARALSMTNTTYADASGFSPASVSTPQDQLVLARLMMEDPVFAQIVAMPQARLPGIGAVFAVNQLLGQEGVVGIKTGYTEEAGGNFVFASRKQVGGRQIDIIGAVMGQVDRPAAFDAARRVLSTLGQGLQQARVISAGQPVATLKPEWSDAVEVVAAVDVQMLLWPGMTLETSVELEQVKPGLPAGSEVGWLELRLGEQRQRVPLKLAQDLPKAGLAWRLTRM